MMSDSSSDKPAITSESGPDSSDAEGDFPHAPTPPVPRTTEELIGLREEVERLREKRRVLREKRGGVYSLGVFD